MMAQEARARKLDQSAAVKAKIALQSDQILANAVYQELTAGDPDDAALRAYYDAHKQDWDEVKARHILIRMQGSRVPLREGHKDLTEEEALAKAKEVRAKIVAGAKFEDEAKIESDDTGSGENGGDLGTFGAGQMVPEFDEVVFKAPVGQVTEPIKTAYGYHLILVEERKSKPFEEARARHRAEDPAGDGPEGDRGAEGQDHGGLRRRVFRQEERFTASEIIAARGRSTPPATLPALPPAAPSARTPLLAACSPAARRSAR